MIPGAGLNLDGIMTVPNGNTALVVDAHLPSAFAITAPYRASSLVEQLPTDLQTLGDLQSVPVAARTNIQDAVQLGLALLPAETNKRLVLLSDGGQNAGNSLVAARLAAAHGVPLSYVDLGLPSSAGEAQVT